MRRPSKLLLPPGVKIQHDFAFRCDRVRIHGRQAGPNFETRAQAITFARTLQQSKNQP